jgi:hypothetical protein
MNALENKEPSQESSGDPGHRLYRLGGGFEAAAIQSTANTVFVNAEIGECLITKPVYYLIAA